MLTRSLISLATVLVMMGAILFIAAGTIDYWQAWLFLVVYGVSTLLVTLWLARRDPALLERRMKGGPFEEKESSQRIVMTVASIGFVAPLVIGGLDRRWGWSAEPNDFVFAADALMSVGWLGVLSAFRANSFAAATIQVEKDQRLISTGPYAVVRHPMYAAGSLLLMADPMALGSWWALMSIALTLPALVWRITDEERVLMRDLPGYAAYRARVRWRLIPGLW